MDKNEIEKRIIENYQSDEKMMILIFCQWCVNNNLNPQDLYLRAYPDQTSNAMIEEMKGNTVSKEESEVISDATVLHVLQLFGNNDLAFIVQEEIEKRDAR